MRVIRLEPMLKITKENEKCFYNMYITIGDRIKVINREIIKGIYFGYKVGYVEEDDTLLILLDDDTTEEIQESKIVNILKI